MALYDTITGIGAATGKPFCTVPWYPRVPPSAPSRDGLFHPPIVPFILLVMASDPSIGQAPS